MLMAFDPTTQYAFETLSVTIPASAVPLGRFVFTDPLFEHSQGTPQWSWQCLACLRRTLEY